MSNIRLINGDYMPFEILSFIIFSDFGFFKKPDVNKDYLTFEYVPKPALLGILGAFAGFSGYRQKQAIPEYYEKFKDLMIGIQPLKIENPAKPPFSSKDFSPLKESILKSFVKYINYHGYGSYEEGGTLIINEQILIKPAFRIFIAKGGCEPIDFQRLKDNLEKHISIYTPYMGKNDFPLSYIYEGEYNTRSAELINVKIASIFISDLIAGIGYRELEAEEETRYDINNNYPYKMKNQQYIYIPVIYSNGLFDINKDFLEKNNYIFCETDVGNILLF